jgi:hypothetical protein
MAAALMCPKECIDKDTKGRAEKTPRDAFCVALTWVGAAKLGRSAPQHFPVAG